MVPDQLDIIYNKLPGKLPTLNISELMADNVTPAALLGKQPRATLTWTTAGVTRAFRARLLLAVCGTSPSQRAF